jgi:transcriptional regulator with XRE-family HTH domain
MDDPLDFPFERLRWARQKAGYVSAKAFAEKAGVGDVTYRAYENGQVAFAKHAPKFAKLLGISTDWLLEGGETPDGAERELANNMMAASLPADHG